MISKPLVESFSDDAPKFLAGREPVASESARERDGFGGNFDEAPCIADWSELLLASLCLAGWFMLFCGGTLIGTAPYVAALSASKDWLATVGSGVIVMLFWTISNIGILCMLSAVLGAFGARTRFASKTAPLPSVSAALLTPKAQTAQETYTQYASACMRGFGVFVLILSGLLVLATDSLISPNQGQYVRLAGMVSVISFYAGYDPVALAELLKRIEQFLRSSSKS